MALEPRVAIASRNQIGESPIWSNSENALYWVDVEGKLIQRWHAIDRAVQSWGMGQAVGCIGLRKRGGLVGAMQAGFFFLDPSTGEATPISDPEAEVADNRFNGRIFVYDFDADDGVPRNRRLFAQLAENEGFPDGLTVDADGGIWNAHYNGWRISRYTPDGRIDRIVRMPVQHVTSLTFGGRDFRTLYITSACLRLTDEQREAQATAGHVFALDAQTQGLPEPMFSG
jgi:sugar lactone lactonase YvrE